MEKTGLRVLLAPLDWGLGHATRCIPIIHELERLGCTVILAAEGPVKYLLENAFDHLKTLPLKGYRMRYHAKSNFIFPSLLLQIPAAIRTKNAENIWLQKVVKEHKIDLLISDNRPGFYYKKIPSVYITHQLSIQTGFTFLNRIAQKIHYRFIQKFSECWVPDYENKPNLAAALSHPKRFPNIPIRYIGILSRLEIVKAEKQTKILFLLSGPEPQRSVLEEKILAALPGLHLQNAVLVRGLPGNDKPLSTSVNGLTIYNYCNAAELSKEIAAAKFVVCRSGYSSLMDLIKLQKKALLIPTPGQGEQIYLAKKLSAEKRFMYRDQNNLDVHNAIQELEPFPFREWDHPSTEIFKIEIEKFLRKNFPDRMQEIQAT